MRAKVIGVDPREIWTTRMNLLLKGGMFSRKSAFKFYLGSCRTFKYGKITSEKQYRTKIKPRNQYIS